MDATTTRWLRLVCWAAFALFVVDAVGVVSTCAVAQRVPDALRPADLLASSGSSFKPRIVNGVDTFDYPTVGALATLSGTIPEGGCTGTLIGCQTFLTAAHCVCSEGSTDAASCRAAGGPTPPSNLVVFFQNAGFFRVSGVAINPNFSFGVGGDVAILTLSTSVTGIAPSRINTGGKPPSGTHGVIVGFGGTGGLQTDNVSTAGVKRVGTVTTAACPPAISGLPIGDANHVCWNFDGQGSTTCHGDSGGPLFIDLGSGPVVAGVTSLGTPNCLPPDSTAETNVFQYRSWVEEQAGADLNNAHCGALPQVGEAGAAFATWSGYLSVLNEAEAHSVSVPPGTAWLRVALNGESPFAGSNFALFVKAGSLPTLADFDCYDETGTPFAFCEIPAPEAGTWYFTAAWLPGGAGDYQLTATLFASNPTRTPTFTRTPLPRPTATLTRTATLQPTATRSPTSTQRPTATSTKTPTRVPSSPTRTFTRQPVTPTRTPSPTPTATRVTSTPTRTQTRTATLRATPTPGPCYGDCSGNGEVTVDELLIGVNIALGAGIDACRTFDVNGDDTVSIDEILASVNAALNGCRPRSVGTPSGATVNGRVTLQRGNVMPPDPSWSVRLTVELHSPGGSVPLFAFSPTSDQFGQFSVMGVPPGIYDIRVKNRHTLVRLTPNVTLSAGSNAVDCGTLLEGDANNDNVADDLDFSLLSANIGLCNPADTVGCTTGVGCADFNESGCVTVLDVSLLASNFSKVGD